MNRRDALYLSLPVLTALVFVTVSNHVWEDFLITFRFSRNLAEGNGLVYHTGEWVHGFTSVFNTLLPALFDWMLPGESIYPALWMYRLVCIAVFSMAVFWVARTLRELGSPEWIVLMAALLLSLDIKSVAFTTNGQEVAFMLFFLALAFRIIALGLPGSHWKIACCAAGWLYTRPDGVVYATVLFGAAVLFASKNRWASVRSVLLGAGMTALLYLPWMLIVWYCYGSPVPHTILAKVGAYTTESGGIFLLEMLATTPRILLSLYNPVYTDGYYEPLSGLVFVFLVLGFALGGLLGGRSSRGLHTTFVTAFLMMGCYLAYGYLKVGIVFPWYKPAVAWLGYLSAFIAFSEIWKRFENRTVVRRWLQVSATCMIALAGFSYLAGTVQLTTHQHLIENGVRKATGKWLAVHAKPGDRVHSEPIGYIGFYSGLTIDDWPGLQSPQVLELRKKLGNDRTAVVQHLLPDWMVLRPLELAYFNQKLVLKQAYEIAAIFDQTDALDQRPWIPGKRYHYFDAKYIVLRKIGEELPSRLEHDSVITQPR